MEISLAIAAHIPDDENEAVTFHCPYKECQTEFKNHTSSDGKARETNCPLCGEILLIPGYVLRPAPRDKALTT